MNQTLDFLNNEYVTIISAMLVALYGSREHIKLPNFIKTLFKNNIFRVVFLSSLLVYKFESNPQIALTVALVFVLTMYFIDQQEEKESFAYVGAYIKSRKM